MTDNQLSAIEKIAKKQTALARKAQLALKAGYPVYLSIGAKNSANTDLSTVTKIIITTGIYIKVKTLTGRYWQNLYKDLDNWSFLLPEQIGKKKNNSKNKVEKKG